MPRSCRGWRDAGIGDFVARMGGMLRIAVRSRGGLRAPGWARAGHPERAPPGPSARSAMRNSRGRGGRGAAPHAILNISGHAHPHRMDAPGTAGMTVRLAALTVLLAAPAPA